MVKLLSGEPQWRNLTAMDHYYENGPLPTWLGWYVQHSCRTASTPRRRAATLLLELVVVWLAWLPRRFRLACFLDRDPAPDRHHRSPPTTRS